MKPLQYALVAYVRNDLGHFVEDLRRELYPEHGHLPAHLTILPPRNLAGSEDHAIQTVQEICDSAEPFEVTLDNIETFMPVTPTIYIRVARGAYKMRELHDKLNIEECCCSEQWPYMPHMTIVKLPEEHRVAEVAERARQRWAEFRGSKSFTVDELTFVREGGENRWIDLAPIHLGSKLARSR